MIHFVYLVSITHHIYPRYMKGNRSWRGRRGRREPRPAYRRWPAAQAAIRRSSRAALVSSFFALVT